MSSPFEELDLEVCVSLLPGDIGEIYAGIRRNIYKFLMRYNEAIGGVLLAVSSLSFMDGSREGRITDEMPHIHFNVKAKAQAFCPRPGHTLLGRVNKVTSSHVGMLVCGLFNASVVAEAMGEGFTYDLVEQTWRGSRGEVIGIGDEATFVVKRMHEAAGLISIEGSFEGVDDVGPARTRTSSPVSPSSPSSPSSRAQDASKPPRKKIRSRRKSTGEE